MSSKHNDALIQAQQDVPADSSTATDDTQTAQSDGTHDPGPTAGTQSGEGEKDGKAGGRDIDNVRGELLRKMEQKFARIEGILEGLQTKQAPQAAPAKGKDWQDMTAAELRALESQVPEASKAEFDRLVREREIREAARQEYATQHSQHQFAEKRQRANTEAYDRWPQLSDTQGAFYREVNKELNEMGEGVAKASPTAVRDAANAVGLRLGMTPAASRLMATHRHGAANGRTAPPPDGRDNAYGLSDDAMQKISPKLAGALKSGKFTKEQLARIKERSKQYDEHRNLLIK